MSEGLVCIFTFSFSLSVNTYTLTFIHLFIQKKYLLRCYYEPSIILGGADAAMNSPCPHGT